MKGKYTPLRSCRVYERVIGFFSAFADQAVTGIGDRSMRKYITFKQAAALVAAVSISLAAQRALADVGDELSKERREAREWYQNAKFGAFVTWGIYSLMGGANGDYIAEWVMEEERIPINKYKKLAENFNPAQFDAEEWAQIFEDAGAKYVTFVTKHHDGFAMFDSKVSAYETAYALHSLAYCPGSVNTKVHDISCHS